MRVFLLGVLFACLLLCACVDRQVAVKARGQVEMGFGYQKQ